MSNDINDKDFIDYDAGLEPQEFFFKHKGHKYVLREASEDIVAKFKNKLAKMSRMSNEGQLTPGDLEGLGDLDSFLVSGCTFKLEVDREGKPREVPVSQNQVKGWPHRIIKDLFKKAHDMSRMTDDSHTVEGVKKQIAILQDRLAKLEEIEGNEAKN